MSLSSQQQGGCFISRNPALNIYPTQSRDPVQIHGSLSLENGREQINGEKACTGKCCALYSGKPYTATPSYSSTSCFSK